MLKVRGYLRAETHDEYIRAYKRWTYGGSRGPRPLPPISMSPKEEPGGEPPSAASKQTKARRDVLSPAKTPVKAAKGKTR